MHSLSKKWNPHRNMQSFCASCKLTVLFLLQSAQIWTSCISTGIIDFLSAACVFGDSSEKSFSFEKVSATAFEPKSDRFQNLVFSNHAKCGVFLFLHVENLHFT